MPSIGTIMRGREIGSPAKYRSRKYIWTRCPFCGYERWAPDRLVMASQRQCQDCAIIVSGQAFKVGKAQYK